MSTTPQSPTITSFRDALGLAMALADEFAFANAAGLIDDAGTVVDLAVVEGIGQTIEPLLHRTAAMCDPHRPFAPALDGNPRGSPPVRAVLLSVRPYEVDSIREEDLRLFRQASWVLAAAGLELLDWIETDGDLYRSYAYITCPAAAWGIDQLTPDDHPGQ